jgi:Fe2+ or Zn2+ uptake regulation protein
MQTSIDFYNTVKMQGDELKLCKVRAKDQKSAVLGFLKTHSGKWTAYEIHEGMNECMLITSIRRCLTDLFHAGEIKHDSYKREKYNVKNKQYYI